MTSCYNMLPYCKFKIFLKKNNMVCDHKTWNNQILKFSLSFQIIIIHAIDKEQQCLNVNEWKKIDISALNESVAYTVDSWNCSFIVDLHLSSLPKASFLFSSWFWGQELDFD